MAPSSNLISLLFFTALLFSLQTSARESQFFSKVPHFNNNLKDTEVVPNNEAPVEKEQVAEFIPETDNSYGLYGHESGLNPPSSTTTTTPTTTFEPYKSESEGTSKFTNNNNYYSFNKDSYSTKQNELSDARLAGNSYSSNSYNNYFYDNTKDNGFSDKKYSPMENQNSNNQKYYYNNNNYNDRYSFNNGERQGLSDTRFVEGGKYFYDVNSDKYNPTARVVGVSSQNWYNNRGYFGNNNYENKKSMEGYQNQDVYEDNQEVFEP
ncbi:hypothetical protein PIB30_021592 [Stylosanthes scabra]|uniref:Protein E6 n=1 Tax=Stylosanthes scabra TaxID=79078 RepID=A0ABU6U9Y5_9FABA|nr:hypothetical protein [Stylosanthes scabra]